MKALETKMIRSIFLVFTSLLVALPTKGGVLYVHPSVSSEEASLYSEIHKIETFKQKEVERLQNSASELQLLKLFKTAQSDFLSKSTEFSVIAFKKIIAKKHEADWSPGTRAIIHYSFLRLAQLSDSKEKLSLFEEALAFDASIEPDTKIFPPPLVKAYNKIRRDLETTEIQLKKFQEYPVVILVNGKLIDPVKTNSMVLFPGIYRITLVSDYTTPQTHILNSNQIATLNPPRDSLISGQCNSSAQIRKPLLNQAQSMILFKNGCAHKPKSKNSTQKAQYDIPKQLSPPVLIENPSHPIETLNTQTESQTSKWVIGGLIVAGVAGLVYLIADSQKQSQKKKSKKTQPTHELVSF